MIVTIDGSLDQILETLAFDKIEPTITTRRRRSLEHGRRQEILVKKRRLVRRAFDVVRHSETEKPAMRRLLDVLSGRAPMTDNVLDLATSIILKSVR